MALNAACVWEVRTDGNDGNGGGFKAGASGTDRSQQAAAHATLSTSSTVHSTTTQVNVAAGDYTVTSADVGNLVQITGGTATAGFYEITAADTVNNRWTLDRAAGTAGQTVVGKMGGALASPGLAVKSIASGNTVWIKAGTYTISTTTPGASGPLHSTTTQEILIRGYSSVRGDDGTAPVLQCSVGTLSVVKLTGGGYTKGTDVKGACNVSVDGNGQSAVVGFEFGANFGGVGGVIRCLARSCATGFATTSGGTAIFVACSAVNCTTGVSVANGFAFGCMASGGTTGFAGPTSSVQGSFARCVAVGCSGVGFTHDSYGHAAYASCVAHGCGSHGFVRATYAMGVYVDCVASGNGGYGFSVPLGMGLYGCVVHGNTSGATSTTPYLDTPAALSASPWVAATADLRPSVYARKLWSSSLQVPGLTYGRGCAGAVTPAPEIPVRTRPMKGTPR